MLNTDADETANDHATAGRRKWHPLARPACPSGRLIHLKERNLVMLKHDLIIRNPLRLLGHENEDILGPGQFGAILARAGVGKTALLVQIALNSMLSGKNVLHISLNEPVGKVNVWYQEVLGRLSQQYQVPNLDQLWDTIVPRRFIMTFQVEGFSAPKLEERLTDVMSQGIFSPHLIIIDGQPFDQDVSGVLGELKVLARRLGLPIWFTITTHRHEAPAADGLPIQLSPLQDLFEVAMVLQPVEGSIHIKALKGCTQTGCQPPLVLDPATMLIHSKL
ncbi:MAG: cytoplasmic protein [Desulfobacteraceae bacterium]|nr:MAG: cytoplasmic protein [Desulfobacteraceae bacterium]